MSYVCKTAPFIGLYLFRRHTAKKVAFAALQIRYTFEYLL